MSVVVKASCSASRPFRPENPIRPKTPTQVCAIIASRGDGFLAQAVAFLAITLAMINVVGGYTVTDRMLGSFKKKEKK